MKRVFPVFILLSLLLVLLLPSVVLADTSGYWEYYVDPGDVGYEATIYGYTGSATSITVPTSFAAKYFDVSVTAYVTGVTTSTFYYNDTVKTINFGANSKLTLVGEISSCDNLTTVNLSGTKITEFNGCSGCSKLTTVTLPTTVTKLYQRAFYGTALSSFTIPNTVTTLSGYDGGQFESCKQLKSITIGTGLTQLGNEMFKDCSALATVNFAATSKIGSIGKSAFAGCTALSSITLPPSLTSIGDNAFSSCTSLQQLTLPANLTTLGNNVFNNTNLTTLNLPSKVSSINPGAFTYAYKLSSLTVDSANPNFSAQNGVLYNKNQTKLVCYPRYKSGATFTVPSTIHEIGEKAFFSSKLQKIYLTPSVQIIKPSAFAYSNSLTNIYCCGNAPYFEAQAMSSSNTNCIWHYAADATGWDSPLNGPIASKLQVWADMDHYTNGGTYHPASCTEYGWYSGRSCPICGKTKDKVINTSAPPTGHQPVESLSWVIDSPATEQEPGRCHGECSCGDTVLADCQIPATAKGSNLSPYVSLSGSQAVIQRIDTSAVETTAVLDCLSLDWADNPPQPYTLEMPVHVFSALIAATPTQLRLLLPNGTVTLSADSLAGIGADVPEPVQLQLAVLTETELPNDRQSAITSISNAQQIKLIRCSLHSGSSPLFASFSVDIPFSRLNAGLVNVYAIHDDNTLQEIPATYDAPTRQLSFEAAQSGDYLVVEYASTTLNISNVTGGISYAVYPGCYGEQAILLVAQYDVNRYMLQVRQKLLDLSNADELSGTVEMTQYDNSTFRAFLLDTSWGPLSPIATSASDSAPAN